MRLQVDLDIKIARRAAIDTGFAITAGADPHTVVDAGRNLHLQRLVLADAPHAIARHAGIGDLFTRAMTSGAGLLHTEKPLLHAHCPVAVTSMAGTGRGARLGAGTVTDVA